MNFKSKFENKLNTSVKIVDEWIKNSNKIKIISHKDTDGISSVALMKLFFNKIIYEPKTNQDNKIKQKKVEFENISTIDEEIIENNNTKYDLIILTDIGSNMISYINLLENNKDVSHNQTKWLILDHHSFIEEYNCIDDNKINENCKSFENICFLNPGRWGIDCTREISGAGVVYLFVEKYIELFKSKEEFEFIKKYSYLPILGSIGDTQEKEGLFGYNKRFLEIAKKEGLIIEEKGLKLHKIQSSNLVQVLKSSYDLQIPNVTNNFRGALEFVRKLNINTKKKNGEYIKYTELSQTDKNKIIEKVIELKKEKKKYDNEDKLRKEVFIQNYFLTLFNKGTPYYDLRELSTIINSCTRYDEDEIGIKLALGDKESTKVSEKILKDYKEELKKGTELIKSDEQTCNFSEYGINYQIFNLKDRVKSRIVGTICSINARSYPKVKWKNFITIVLGRIENENKTKISARVSKNSEIFNLSDILNKVISKIGGKAGGHKVAAGAMIDTKFEDKFIELVKEEITKIIDNSEK